MTHSAWFRKIGTIELLYGLHQGFFAVLVSDDLGFLHEPQMPSSVSTVIGVS